MVDLVPDENPLKSALREIEVLSAYATAYRYPTAAGRIPNAISGGELTAHIERVDAALGEAVRHFGVDLDKKGTPARTPKPIR